MATRPSEELITDRTSSDVSQKRTKGNWNTSDLMRIAKWQVYIRDLLNEAGYYVNIQPRMAWNIFDLPRQSQVDKIRSDTMKLKEAYYTFISTPTLETGIDYVVFNEANDIEKILKDIEILIDNMMESYRYCGTLYCGE